MVADTHRGNVQRENKDDNEGEVPRDEDGDGNQRVLLPPVSVFMKQVGWEDEDTEYLYY